jgi:hypothetical protein
MELTRRKMQTVFFCADRMDYDLMNFLGILVSLLLGTSRGHFKR